MQARMGMVAACGGTLGLQPGGSERLVDWHPNYILAAYMTSGTTLS